MGNIIWQSRTSISNDDYISTNHNHTHIYARDINSVFFDGEPLSQKDYINPDNDPRGPWKLVPIDANHPGGDTLYGITNPKTGVEYFPPNNRIWAFNRETFQSLLDDGRIKFGLKDDSAPKKKLFYNERVAKGDTKTPSSILLDAKTTKDGTNELIDILGKKVFDYPKPTDFVRRLLMYCAKRQPKALILDFFAGSGTTLHATMQLNAEDGGHRQCILVTNNENGICENVTYERNRRVIQGYTTPKGVEVPGLSGNNLRYYRTDFVDRENTHQNRKRLMEASVDLVCLREGIYHEEERLAGRRINTRIMRYFTEGERQLLFVFEPAVIPQLAQLLPQVATPQCPLRLYVFSDGAYAYEDELRAVADRIEVCALPNAIRQAYKSALPRPIEKELESVNLEETVEP